jgi:Fe-Mn family superoxide dismutase
VFVLPELGYAFDALEPVIDTETMETHYLALHAAYVERANAGLSALGLGEVTSVDQLLSSADPYGLTDEVDEFGFLAEEVENLLFNAGGHMNHSLLWHWLSPDGGGEPRGGLGRALSATFGSADAFRSTMEEAVVSLQGSGWTWLIVDQGGLAVRTTSNQENPWQFGCLPILGIDVWEHAYFLNYLSQRSAYVEELWEVINWDFAERLYANYEAYR